MRSAAEGDDWHDTADALRDGSLAAVGLYVSVLVLISPALLFFLWMLSLSLKNEVDNTAYPAGVHSRTRRRSTTSSTCSPRTTS